MSNVQSYNALIDRFKAFASGHFILKSFSHGQIDTADLEKFTQYPFMHVVPSNVTYAKGMKTFSFQIVLADLPRDKDDKVEFQREVLSDLQRIAEDLVAEITNHRVLFGDLITVQNVSLEPFLEEFHNTLTGWTVSLDLLVPYYWDACSIPAEWNDMFESGSGGTGSILTFVDSITRDENGNVSLVNDEAEPAPNYYYGTNDEGVRGWYLLTDEVGLTCATIGTCQTIIDIEAEIDLLQQDVTDLQADVVAIESELPNKVPYTGATGNVDLGEYELKAGQIEFDTTPTGTAGAAVMRWNDTDGTVDVGLKGGNVTLQVGQESVIRVVNKSGGNLLEANYQAVRVRLVSEGGAQGQRLAVVLALADTDADSATTIGLVTETINNNQEGFITTSGEVRGINTTGSLQGETWVDGDILYLSGTTAGRITNIKPSAPTHTIIIGYVVYAHQNNGKIFVKVDNGYELDELHNVSITSPANNNVLTYESSTSLWKNKTVETALGYTPVPTTRSITINGTTQDLSADRTFSVGTVTSVAALTLGTTGTDLSSTVANGTSTPVITLNVPTASATNRGVLSSADWSTFNGKFTLPSLTSGSVLFSNGTTIAQNNANFFWDNTNNRLGIGTASPADLLTLNSNGANARIRFNNTNSARWTIGNNATDNSFRIGNALDFQLAIFQSSGNVVLQNGGTFTDAGYRLDVNGSVRTTGSISAATAIARGTYLNQTLVATANNDVLVGLDIASTFTTGAFTGVTSAALRVNGSILGIGTSGTILPLVNTAGTGTVVVGGISPNTPSLRIQGSPLNFFIGSTQVAQLFATTGNLTLQNGGTFTDVASSRLTINSTTQGFLPPRMTTTQKNAIASPVAGLMVYDTTLNLMSVYNGTMWISL